MGLKITADNAPLLILYLDDQGIDYELKDGKVVFEISRAEFETGLSSIVDMTDYTIEETDDE